MSCGATSARERKKQRHVRFDCLQQFEKIVHESIVAFSIQSRKAELFGDRTAPGARERLSYESCACSSGVLSPNEWYERVCELHDIPQADAGLIAVAVPPA
jgi:hypothetical protein